MTLILPVSKRKIIGKKVKNLRKQGNLPAILYGNKRDSLAIQIDKSKFLKMYNIAGESQIIDLSIDSKNIPVIIHDIKRDPVTEDFLHIDFYEIDEKNPIKATVPLHFVGESEAVKANIGVLVTNLRELEVKALPRELPSFIEVDISSLKQVHAEICIKDIHIGEGIEFLHEENQIIATITPLRTSASLESLDEEVEEDIDAVEGVKEVEEAEESKAPSEDESPS